MAEGFKSCGVRAWRAAALAGAVAAKSVYAVLETPIPAGLLQHVGHFLLPALLLWTHP